MPSHPVNIETTNRSLTVTRVVNAPRELVFKAWSSEAHLARWFGPSGFTITTKSIDFRVGGEWIYTMHGPDGTDYPNRMVYLEVDAPSHLAYDHGGDNFDEGPVFHVSIDFEDLDGKTRMIMRMVFDTAAEFRNTEEKYHAIEGARQCFTRMGDYIESLADDLAQPMCGVTLDPAATFTLSHTFDAPRKLVYAAWTEKDRLAAWFGPAGMELFGTRLDLRPGGEYHYGMKVPNGFTMWGLWTFREIVPLERLIYIAGFADEHGTPTRAPFPGFEKWPMETLTVITFTAAPGGGTTLAMQATPLHATEAEVQTFVGGFSSMNQGWGGTIQQLIAYLANPA